MSLNWTVTYTIKDSRGKLGRFSFYLNRDMPAARHTYLAEPPEPFPDDEVEYFAEIMAVMLHAMIEGQIVKVTLSRDVDLSHLTGMRTIPKPESNVQEGLRLTYSVWAGVLPDLVRVEPYSHVIPTIRQDAFQNGVFMDDTDITDEIPPGVVVLPDPLFMYHWAYQFSQPEDAEIGYDWSGGRTRDYRGDRIGALISAEKVFTAR